MKIIHLTLLLITVSFSVYASGNEAAGKRVAENDSFIKKGIAALQNQIRPFERVSAEYVTEGKRNGKWFVKERVAIVEEIKTGFFKSRTMRRFDPESNGSAVCEERVWNGVAFSSVIFPALYNEQMLFKNIFKSDGQATISSGGASSFSLFMYCFRTLFGAPLFEILRNLEKEDVECTIDNKNIEIRVKSRGVKLLFNPESGLLMRITLIVSTGDSDKYYDCCTIDVKRTKIVNGYQVPLDFIYRGYNPAGKIVYEERISVVPESVKIDPMAKSGDFDITFPVGTRVTDYIEKTDKTVTEADLLKQGKAMEKALDELVSDVKRQAND